MPNQVVEMNVMMQTQTSSIKPEPARFKVYTQRHLDQIAQLQTLPEALRFEIKVMASIFPFRVNDYVLNTLIDWKQAPNDPLFQLCFPQRDMISAESFERMASLFRRGADEQQIAMLARELRATLNPHPAGQMELNVPQADGEKLAGMQHKYRETVLFFPSQGQVCHSYCTFCFRWAQFVGDKELRFAAHEAEHLYNYLKSHQEVTDLLITGGDPMVMKTAKLRSYLQCLNSPELAHVQTLRIGSKALSFWPHRFVTDEDADELLALFEQLVRSGKHVALMAHYNHWRELDTPIAQEAIRRIRATGVEIRSQGPLLRHINDDPAIWEKLWREQVRLGVIPYYLFIERDTGAHPYFAVPLARAWEIYRAAIQQVSGLSRTARGPSMSTGPGKIEIQGVAEINGEKVFVLRFIQGRNPAWVLRPFFARYDPAATWLDQLKPAFGEQKFFFEDEYQAMLEQTVLGSYQ